MAIALRADVAHEPDIVAAVQAALPPGVRLKPNYDQAALVRDADIDFAADHLAALQPLHEHFPVIELTDEQMTAARESQAKDISAKQAEYQRRTQELEQEVGVRREAILAAA